MSNFRNRRRQGWFSRFIDEEWLDRLPAPLRGLLWLFRQLTPRRLARHVYNAFAFVFRFHSPKWQEAAELLAPPEENVRWTHLANPVYLVIWGFRFVWAWITSRPYASLAPASLFVAVAMAVLFGVIYQREAYKVWGRTAKYRQVVDASLASRDFKTAGVALGTLIDLDPEDVTYRYQFATVQEGIGNQENANEWIRRLAFKKSYGPAALKLLQRDYDLSKFDKWTDAQKEEYRTLATIATKNLSGNDLLAAKTLLAQYLLGTGAYQEALRYYAELAERKPEFALTTAILSNQFGDQKQKAFFGEQAIRFYEEKLRDAGSNVPLRLELAKALMLMQREEAAAQTLEAGYQITKDESLRVAAGEALALWSIRLGEEGTDANTLIRRLKLVESALLLAPNNGAVIEATVNLVLECRKNENQEIRLVRAALLKGISPIGAHFIQGTLALFDGNFDEAKTHLEIASKHGAQMPGILNNLAVAMAGMPDANLEQALELSNAALKQLPNHPYIRETRGQILIKLERWEAAIADLEVSLAATELHPQIYPSLAKAYRALGNESLAKEYESQVPETDAVAPKTPAP